jgi:hypothetical protein
MTPLLGALAPRRPAVLALVDLVQDIDVMLPVLLELQRRGEVRLKIAVSRWLVRESPRTIALLDRHGLGFSLVRRREVIEGRSPSLRGVAAVIAASESSHPAHAAGHALLQRAGAAGLATYALQHGFEAVGLYGVEAGAARFAARTVFCWFPPTEVPPALADETRARLAHVGRPAAPASAPSRRFDVGVFENLHWERYSEADRLGFLNGLKAAAEALPGVSFLLRTHPAGAFADRLGHELARFQNITRPLAAEARSRLESGADLVLGLGRVITTPSTVALDAAMAGTPVALAVDGGAAYHPLPVLRGPQDWIAFASGGAFDGRSLDQFVSRVLLAGDGAGRVAERMIRDLMVSGPRHHG